MKKEQNYHPARSDNDFFWIPEEYYKEWWESFDEAVRYGAIMNEEKDFELLRKYENGESIRLKDLEN